MFQFAAVKKELDFSFSAGLKSWANLGVSLGCLGILAGSLVTLSGCTGGGTDTQQEAKKEAPLTMAVQQVDQVSKLEDRVPDGQYLVTKLSLKNNTNTNIPLAPDDFSLQNITNSEKDRYSQPAEKGMSIAFGAVYGPDKKSKLMDLDASNLYPRMQIERYLVFMVPLEADLNGYQIFYKPGSVSVPLVKPEVTVINDHRSESSSSASNVNQSP